ncbi:nonspecific lipid-transfer protein, mitochondrial precursor [Halenospora varia]|nr:nonspecific lipid-transfer protein, mitochondrial precursor [Halenospora varia]
MGKSATRPCYVLGVGMTKFIKPRGKVDYQEIGYEAGIKALLDAHIDYDCIEHGVACYVYGDSTSGQRVFYQFGLTEIPIYNVNNNCSTGSTGLFMGRNIISSGQADCVMVVGFEKMNPGSLSSFWTDRESPTERFADMTREVRGIGKAPFSAQLFGNAGREYMEKYGATKEDLAEIARANHEHSQRNPYSQFQQNYTLQQILDSPMIWDPLTKLQCCPTSDGAAAAILVSQDFLDARPHLKSQAILIAGQSLKTDGPTLYSKSAIDLIGHGMSKHAGEQAMKEAGIVPADVNVCELHDCFSANQMVTIDALGLSPPGKAHEMVRAGDTTYGGKMVINPSGGLISKGHPLGATGLAQCAELVWHLRGWANNRLVNGGSAVALQHNLGLGGAVVVTVYKRADGKESQAVSDGEIAKLTGLGYNPAVQAKGFTVEQATRARSKTCKDDFALGGTQVKVMTNF